MLNTTLPLVSIIVPTINRGGLLRKAITSILEQSYKNVEIIIVDDCSYIPVILNDLYIDGVDKNNRVQLLRNVVRKGGAASRNIGIQYARGEYIGFLDDDDEYHPRKVETLVDFLEKNGNVDVVFGKISIINNGKEINLFEVPSEFNWKKNLLLLNMIHNNSTIIRKSSLGNIRFYEGLSRYQDTQFNIELSTKLRIQYINQYVATWNVDDRPDKITFDGDVAKKAKDLASLIELYRYLKQSVSVPEYLLSGFALKVLRAGFSLRDWGCVFSFVRSNNCLSIFWMINSILVRRKYFYRLS